MASGFRYEDWSEGTVTFGVVAFTSENICHHMHLHSQVELMIVESGEYNAIIDGNEFIISEGNGVLVCPHVAHRFRSVGEGCKMSTFIFSTEFIADFKGFFESAKVPYVRMEQSRCPEFALAQVQYLFLFSHSYSIGKTVMKGLLTVLLSGIMPAYSGGEFEKYNDRSSNFEICRQLLLYIDNNISSDLSLEKISKALNIVPSYVSTVFSRNFNTSLNSYITKKRISVAKALLSNSAKSITEIAFDSGFSSIRSFNRRFRESEGLTPSDFRESFMNSNKKSS